jgi:hypothetical protein
MNAMFAGLADVTESVIPTQRNRPSPANKITMLKYMELEQDFIIAENKSVNCERMQLQLDQMLSMYDHVKQFGVDRAFLALYNDNGQLGKATGIKFPSFESMDCVGVPTSTYSQMFIAAMEDENGGLLSKLWNWIKLLWQSLKRIASTIWQKIKSFFGSAEKSDAIMVEEIMEMPEDSKVSCTIETIKKYAWSAIIAAATTWATVWIQRKVTAVLDDNFAGANDREHLLKEAKLDTDTIDLLGSPAFKKAAKHLSDQGVELNKLKDEIDAAMGKINNEGLENIINTNPDLSRAYKQVQAMRSNDSGLFNYNFDVNTYGEARFQNPGFFKGIFTKVGRAIKFHSNTSKNVAREVANARMFVHQQITTIHKVASGIKQRQEAEAAKAAAQQAQQANPATPNGPTPSPQPTPPRGKPRGKKGGKKGRK